jgi:hypothetical protein
MRRGKFREPEGRNTFQDVFRLNQFISSDYHLRLVVFPPLDLFYVDVTASGTKLEEDCALWNDWLLHSAKGNSKQFTIRHIDGIDTEIEIRIFFEKQEDAALFKMFFG